MPSQRWLRCARRCLRPPTQTPRPRRSRRNGERSTVWRLPAGLVATDQSRARRQARAVVLTAQRDLYDELRACSRAAVARLRDDPDYPRMLARLSDRARAALGSAAVLGEPEDGG